VATVDASLMRQEWREPVIAVLVEHPIGTTFAHARNIGDGDCQEVERIGDRGAMEVAVALDAAVMGDDRIV